MRYQRKLIVSQYDMRMNEIELALKGIIQNIQEEKSKPKISQSFCLGVDHSLLLGNAPVVI
jgi:hypothetical protein